MICQKCHVRQAGVHMQQNVNGALTEMHLCQQCAQELQIGGLNYPLMVAGFLQSLLGASAAHAMEETEKETGQEEGQGDACPSCHTTAARIQHTGLVGCADCYEHFANQMDKWLRRIQGQVQHMGKVPHRFEKTIRDVANMEELRMKLQLCIDKEAFEEAAVLRDRIREQENQKKGEGDDVH